MSSLAHDLAAPELERLNSRFAARSVALADGGVVSVRECGQAKAGAAAYVCLHGIGSGAASWLDTALLLAEQADARVIAWDMPGYGDSTPVAPAQPKAHDYAHRLQGLVDALDLDRFVLVGHSLGAITAAWAARDASPLAARIEQLVLISPALGYGAAGQQEQAERVRRQRIETLIRDGVAGMAAKADQRLVSEHADARARQWVRWNMGRLNEAGYLQAVELLAGANVLQDLPPAMPVRVACGALDIVTTPTACEQAAHACGVPLHLFEDAGHACYVEQPQAVATWLQSGAPR
ncbi:alpha/beta hydrolase [Variovorax dokdonensis]|uniref:Alpha/beta hydrolase n=1 Tax=Variovorax dokdonensis TaxID=344883 RepID=A0ABT7ND01_9BURK|nr:alpha/beta hydrolase [Variovorax dokdonensis]MDM0045801.1 alpha/beta hydrolase [Variovorax dokdonensis]